MKRTPGPETHAERMKEGPPFPRAPPLERPGGAGGGGVALSATPPNAKGPPLYKAGPTTAPIRGPPPPTVNTNPQAQQQQQQQQFQRLKVEDALSYLDQVKFKFGSKPKVYNDFLDIMKEFKSQSIDTPGVITRVSCLFRGHPELIVGFNTFLPPGYKIEVQRNDSVTVNMGGLLGPGMQTIVHTPTGVHTMGALGDITAIPHLTAAAASSSSAASIQPVTPQPPTPQPAVAIRPVPGTLQHPTKFNSQPPTIKENSNSSRPTIEANLLPQNVHLFATTTPPSTQLTSLTPHVNTASLTLSQPTPIAVTTSSNATVVTCATTIIPTGPPLVQPAPLAPQPTAQPPVITTTSLPQHPHHPHNPPTSNAATTTVVVDRGVANQPIEFNHAINYVNKIKNRFQGQPDVYKQFLEILHTYQKDQKAIKEGVPPSGNHLTEAEVYTQVSKLFQNQEDLLSEFGQFLPEATNDNATSAIMMSNKGLNNDHASAAKKPGVIKHTGLSANSTSKYGIKRPPSGISYPAPKKQKIGVLRDVSLAEAGKFGTLNEFAFFDKVRKALRNTTVYENFLRCLMLFNQEVISRSELVLVTTPFLNKHPELFEWFKNFLSYKEGSGGSNGGNNSTGSASSPGGVNSSGGASAPASEENETNLPHVIGNRDRVYGDSAVEIDYATCKRLGASYCAVPKSAVSQAQSSKRSQLCREVLNDTWVSFPTWSEDSQFVTSRKTQYEESIYRTEDERFEFDVILETNRDTIKVLECVQRKMSRMPPEEAARYKLDDTLGGNSPTIHQRAIRRIYGDRSQDIIEGLKRNPVVAVPIVLKRLSQKDEEWREVQKNFNKTWRDQNEKYYLKSLDHQGLNFKQTDVRNLRCKSLQQEIETLYDERHEQMEGSGETINGPHMTLDYSYSAILEDANNLLIHHVKRQPSINKEDKQRIKSLLKYFLMDIFRQSRQELSDDEKEDNDEDENENYNNDSSDKDKDLSVKSTRSRRKLKEEKKDKISSSIKKEKETSERDIKIENKEGRPTPLHAREMEADETYTHMMCNNNWYLFFRLHNLLCERITKIYNQAVLIAEEESKEKNSRKESTAVALRLKPKNEIDIEDYYPAFLDMVKNVLDGNMDIITFEDTLREMFGIHAYIAYTLDKVVTNAVRQLVNLVTEDLSIACQDLFVDESKENATGGPCASANQRQMSELLYQKRCEKLLTDQNCMKFLFYHQSGKVTVELLDTDSTSSSSSKQGSKLDEEAHSRKWHKYIDRFIQPGEDVSDECKNRLILKPVFLPRGIRSYRKSPFGKMKITNKTAVKNDQNSGESSDEKIKEEGDEDEEDGGGGGGGSKHLNSGGVVYEDNMQCNFNPRSFKVLYVIKSENCFYRRLALRRAKESHKTVSQRKTKGFSKWHSSWIEKNVSESQQSSISDWFMGLTDGLIPNKTHKIIKNHSDSTPYRTFFKWRADVS